MFSGNHSGSPASHTASSQGLTQHLTQGTGQGLTQDLTQVTGQGLTQHLTQVTGQGLTQGLTQHLTQGHGTNLQYIFQHISDKSSARSWVQVSHKSCSSLVQVLFKLCSSFVQVMGHVCYEETCESFVRVWRELIDLIHALIK